MGHGPRAAEAGKALRVRRAQPCCSANTQRRAPRLGASGYPRRRARGSGCLCSVTAPHRSAPGAQTEPPVLRFVPSASCPASGRPGQSLTLLSVRSLQVSLDVQEMPLSLLLCRLSGPSSLSLFSWERCSIPSIKSSRQLGKKKPHLFQLLTSGRSIYHGCKPQFFLY